MSHLVVMAAGTGGHIIPGLAVAAEMQRRGWSVSWLGTSHGMENQLVPQAGIALDTPDVPAADPAALWGEGLVREDVEGFPELGELEVVRHFTRISQHNLGIGEIQFGVHFVQSLAGVINKQCSAVVVRKHVDLGVLMKLYQGRVWRGLVTWALAGK